MNLDPTAADVQLGDLGGRLASIIECSDDAIISKTLDGVITTWNAAAERIFGYSAEEMIGQPISRLFPPERLDEETVILGRLRRGDRVEHYETERLRKDGARVAVSLSVSPIRDREGGIIGASKIARDITAERALRRRLDELQSELLHVARLNDMGQMAQAFAHELNQPLSALGNYVASVKVLVQSGEREKAIHGCELAQKQVLRAGDVVRRLRDFIKKSETAQQPEDLVAAIEESLILASISARDVDLRSELDIADDARRVVMDRIQIQQVLINLMRNAIQAMAQQSRQRLAVSARRCGQQVEVAVADSGPGLSPQARSRLFQPFNTTKADGLGVGLSLCRSIIEDHGGTIWAEDGAVGGTVFRFTLPVA